MKCFQLSTEIDVIGAFISTEIASLEPEFVNIIYNVTINCINTDTKFTTFNNTR